MKYRISFFFLFYLLFVKVFSQDIQITNNAKFSVLTVDISSEVHTLYGHTALRVKDAKTNIDVVYNFGMFDFSTPNFALRFVKGDMEYYAAAYPYQDFEYSYKVENRSFYEQELYLSFEEKKQLFDNLNKSVFTEDRFYTYKFIDRNCTTKVIDAINEVLKDKPIQNFLHKDKSYRSILYDYQKDHFYLNLGINLMFGHRPDEQAAVLFLPLDFMEVLKKVKHKGKPLASSPISIFKAFPNEKKFNFFDSIFSLIIILTSIVIINKKWLNIVFYAIIGLIGLFFCLVGLYSLHKEVLWNYNALLFNPLFLILAYALLRNKLVLAKYFSLTIFLFMTTYFLYMFNKAHLIIVLPFIISLGIQLVRTYLKKNKNY